MEFACYETLHVFSSWYEDVHMIWMSLLDYCYSSLFPHYELSHFSPSIYRQGVPREHNSSYNFIQIFLELCTCSLHSLKMCTCFSLPYFCHFLFFLNFVIYWPQMYRQWVPCHCNFLYNFKPVFLKLCTCFLLGLQKCTWVGYDFIYIFITFSTLTLSLCLELWKNLGHIASGLSVCAFVRACVRTYVRSFVRLSCFLVHSVTLEPGMLMLWNFIYGFLKKK